MAGIYIHIPFCRRACHYCDFHFTTNLKNAQELVDAILREIELRNDYLSGESISTIYFGGGTPSLLPTSELERIIDRISTFHPLENDLELTVEANPEDLSTNKLKELKNIGVNRLSLGTQSFIDAELKWMNRVHTSEQAKTAISEAQGLGFDNISIDLIFGLPDQTISDWEFNLSEALKLNVQHISSYALTVEEKTVLNSRIKKGMQKAPDDERTMEFFRMNMDLLPQNGFEHYEISNFAKEGFISRHNSSYWKGTPYLGLGPSAHSFIGTTRQWNMRANAGYIRTIKNVESFFFQEHLSENDRLNENIMIGLRTKWGIEKDRMERIKTGSWLQLISNLNDLEPDNFIIASNAIRLTKKGMQLADGLAAELFFE
ncbi:MAG: radical SAM family heme chaperone HemW [Flavobacteriales bacterium]|nr:radical SAM family heme chaperone HemW [Flavobacteriales bacterium]